ncbi:hypothetical protein [Hymenobacter glacialis]|uniref:Uncharacterized protein n=1 Tax=Hymenobacter glacialis TaxID=1908236 RepID=A0A1G1T6A3_9BACT|nr:hypothetical protein [Hymenobacter glacialis]OGX86397.1 hypothetical protein BEN48_13020 [Hymenobacter glacialis]
MVRFALLVSLLWLSQSGFAQIRKPLPPGYLLWSTTHRLQPRDFQFQLRPQNNLSQSMGSMGLQMDGVVGDLFGKKANRVVQNVFHSAGSYLDSTDQTGVALQIRYLQTLWDINEVAARHLRQELRAGAKRMLLIGKPDINDLFRTAYENANKRQIQYADETKYGLFLDKQAGWERLLASELAELAAFAVPD